MTRNRVWTLVTTLSLCGLTVPASAQQPSEAHIQELIRTAAVRLASGQGVVPGQSPAVQSTSAPDNRPVVRLTLDDAVKLALDRNLDIAVQRLNPQINDIQIASLRAVYHPTLTSTINQIGQTQASTNQLAGSAAGAVTNDTFNYNGGIAQNFSKGGGSFQATLNNFRQSSDSNNVSYNPLFQSLWSVNYTQPVLRGFKTDSNRQQIEVTKINRDISDIQLKSSITNTLSNVRNAYWDFVYAVQSVAVARQSLDLATKLVQDNQTRVQVGTMAPIDVVSAQSEQATRNQAVVAAESAQRTTELALKRLIVGGADDPNWGSALIPTDQPSFQPVEIDLDGAVRRALAERTDMDIAKKNVAANDVTLKYLNDQTLPQADVAVNYGVQGVGGTFLQRSNTGVLGSSVTNVIPGGLGDAYGGAVQERLSALDRSAESELSARRERSAGLGGACPRPAQSGAGAVETGRAADRHRSHQRGDHGAQQRGGGPGVAGLARAGATKARGGTEQVRSRHVDQLLRRPGTARPFGRAEQRAPRGSQLPEGAGRNGTRAVDDAAKSEHHGSGPMIVGDSAMNSTHGAS